MSERSYFTQAVLNDPTNIGLARHLGAVDDSSLSSFRFVNPADTEGGLFAGVKGVLSDNQMMGSIAGLGSTLAQLAALPSQIDWAKTNTAALKQNIATAQTEQNRRNKNISGFNSIDASKYA